MDTFTTKQTARMTGLTVRQLDYWAQETIFVPGIRQAFGSGTRKCYSCEDIVQLRALKKIKTARWSTQKIHQAIGRLREVMDDPNPLRQAILIADRQTLLAIYKTEQGRRELLDALQCGGQRVLSLVLETVAEETRRDIDAWNK